MRAGSVGRAALGQHPVFAWIVAGVAVGQPLKVVLMLRLGLPEIAGRLDLGDDGAGPQAGRVDVGDGALRFLALGFACEVDSGPV